MAKKARKKSAAKSKKASKKKSKAAPRKKTRPAAKRKKARKAKRKTRRKTKRKTIGGRIASAYRTVVATVKETDRLRNKMEPPGTSESE